MKSHILPLFQPETSVSFIVCGPAQKDEIVAGFKKEGFEVELREVDDRMPWDVEGTAKKEKARGQPQSQEKDEAKTKAEPEAKEKMKGKGKGKEKEEEKTTQTTQTAADSEKEKEKETITGLGTLGRLKILSIGRSIVRRSIFPFRKGTKRKALHETSRIN